MKWKLDENGKIVVDENGNPILIDGSGEEKGFDPVKNRENFTKLNKEAESHRLAAKEAKESLSGFGEYTPEQVRDAIAEAKALKEGQGGEVAKVSEEFKRLMAEQKEELEKERDAAINSLKSAQITNAFSSSKFVNEKVSIPADFLQSRIGANFDINENGDVVYLEQAGDPKSYLRSNSDPTKPASFDEAVAHIINSREDRESILKANGSGGAGGRGGSGGGGGNVSAPSKLSDCKTDAEKIAWVAANSK